METAPISSSSNRKFLKYAIVIVCILAVLGLLVYYLTTGTQILRQANPTNPASTAQRSEPRKTASSANLAIPLTPKDAKSETVKVVYTILATV
ncbi:MAG: hypothetical protein US19_C0017G0001, partial [Candidatus Daviesbacteria bacterium GW2011_GWB1_36_5]